MNIINWPLTIIILGGIALLTCRPALIRLLDRLKSASKEGFQFDRPQEQSNRPLPLQFIEIMSLPLSPSASAREKLINEQLHAWQIQEPMQQAHALTRALAITRLNLEFSNTAHLIFGSQLHLLHHLSSFSHGINRAEAIEIFHVAQADFPELHAHRTTEDWLAFLTTAQLVTVSESTIIMTQYGRDFLKYLIDESLTFPRYG